MVIPEANFLPVVKALGLKGGLHAFRHGNATAQDQLNVPMATRQSILGHNNARTTMKYTHLLTEDARRIPEMLDEYFGMVEVTETTGRVN